MNKKEKRGAALSSVLHIIESKDSRDRAEADLKAPDGAIERARAVLEPHQDKNSNKNNIKNSEPKNE
jgi:hypothetical protein